MSDYERGSGPVEIAGPRGRILDVGGRSVEVNGSGHDRDLNERSGPYPTRDEFVSSLRAEERTLAEDKRRVAEMAPRWRDRQRKAFDDAFEEWRAERQRRAEKLFAKANGEAEGFPPPAEHFGRRRR
jgi:hypothetical protein